MLAAQHGLRATIWSASSTQVQSDFRTLEERRGRRFVQPRRVTAGTRLEDLRFTAQSLTAEIETR